MRIGREVPIVLANVPLLVLSMLSMLYHWFLLCSRTQALVCSVAELTAVESQLAMQAHCRDQTTGMLCISGCAL